MSLKFITDFHAKVKNNPKQFGKKIHIACQMVERLLKSKKVEYKKSDVVAFFDMCKLFRHWKGTSKKIELDIVQKWVVACVLGIKEKRKSGEWAGQWLRYFRECRIFVAKKWGKSVLMALFAIWGLLFDNEEGPDVYCLAVKKEQAKQVFDNIVVYLKQCPQLQKVCLKKYADGQHYIECTLNNGTIKYLSSSKEGIQGKNAHMVLCDEGQEIKDQAVFNSVRTSQANRRQPLAISMSTASVTPQSMYHQMYSEIEAMCESKKFDDKTRTFFAVFEIDADDNIDDKTCWIKANPALLDGRPTLEHLEKEYALSKIGDGEKSLPTFIAFHLNRSCDGAQTYFTTDLLKKCVCDITDDIYYDTYAFGGTDLAEFTDLANKTTLIPYWHGDDDGTFTFYVLQRYFAPEKRIEKNSETDKVLYKQFANTKSKGEYGKELLRLCQGDIVNFDEIAADFKHDETKYEMLYLKNGYDKWKSGQFLIAMNNLGFTQEKRLHNADGSLEMRDDGVMTEVRQGKFLSEAIKYLKVLMENGRIKFDHSNLLFPMCCTNAKVSTDKDNLMSVEKQKSRGRIDGLIGVLCALMSFLCYKDQFLKNILPYETRNRLKKE